MKSHELCRELLEKFNAKEVASALGLSTSLIYKWTQPPDDGSGALNPLDRVEQLLKLTEDTRIAGWVCERAGGYFVEDLEIQGKKKRSLALSAATNETVEEFAEMLSEIATAAHDNSISSQEAQVIRAQWQRLKSTTEEFVRCCEEGKFESIRGHGKPHPTTGS